MKFLLTGIISLSIICKANAQMQYKYSEPMATRQVHLDFHTSELIPDIGTKFNKKQFQQALKVGNINSINVFAKCHHSWSYYPTEIGNMHPNLKFDLLGAQIEACHEIGVKAPIYFTVGWSASDAEKHPEWLILNKDGSVGNLFYDTKAPKDASKPFYSWKCLDAAIDNPYHKFVMSQAEEICKRYKVVDGFWFDIYHIVGPNYNASAMERMKREGVDVNDEKAVARSQALALKAHMKALRELVAKYHPKATVFFNTATRVEDKAIFKERLYDMNTQQDLEDLPTTWGGYDKLPLESKFHLGQGIATTAMSGKFHKAWGEFGGFKNKEALRYEAAAMISYGVSCNFGDQLHPLGEMDMETYKNIGYAFEYVKKIEQYGPGGMPIGRLGLWLTMNTEADRGAANMLLELHKDFIIANEKNLNNLSLLILPSGISLTEAQANLINAWVQKGGKLIAFGNGILDAGKTKSLIDIGANYVKQAVDSFDYTLVQSALLQKNVVTTPFLNYEGAVMVQPTTATTLAAIKQPFFNRTYEHYMGHRETPYKLENAAHPAIIKNGNVIYFAHSLDKLYFVHGVFLHKQIIKNAIEALYTNPMIYVKGLPSAGRVSFLKQETKRRYIAHMLYSPPLLRGVEVQVIEDFPIVPQCTIEVNVPEKIKAVKQIPQNKSVPFKQAGNKITITSPSFTMHTGFVFEY
jgi:hypothetical protein